VRALRVVAPVLPTSWVEMTAGRIEGRLAETFTPSAVSCNDASPTLSPAAFFSSARAAAAWAVEPNTSQVVAHATTQAVAIRFR
jgi:hypothetical protein